MICEEEIFLSKKTTPSRFAAEIRIDIGVVNITAPTVPPRTIIAAVTCARSANLPPSRTRPPRIPPSARTSPPILARSSLVPPALPLAAAALLSAMGFRYLAQFRLILDDRGHSAFQHRTTAGT